MSDFTPKELLQHIVSLEERRKDLLEEANSTEQMEKEALEAFVSGISDHGFLESHDFMVKHYGQPYHVHIGEDWHEHDRDIEYAVTVTKLSSADALVQAEGNENE